MSGLKLLSATIRYLVNQQSLPIPSTKSENKILRQLGRKKQLLIVPLTFWSGIEQGFFGADFTAVSVAGVLKGFLVYFVFGDVVLK